MFEILWLNPIYLALLQGTVMGPTERLEWMNVLVTGAGGFVAPHVANAFRNAGHTVRTTDARPVEADPESITADFTDSLQASDLMKGIEVVCHLGGVGDVYLALEQPEEAALANVVGTANLLRAAKMAGVSKFIYTSTWEVYGEPEYQPLDEDHRCEPDHPYGITKLAGERLSLSYDALKDQPVIALRLGTAFGIGMRPNSVFSIFIDKAQQGEALTVQGSGAQSRQFTHVSDIASAFLSAAESDVRGEVFNIVAEESISIRQLAELIAEEIPTQIEQVPARTGDVVSAIVSSKKAEDLLSWRAETDFRSWLRELIRHKLDS